MARDIPARDLAQMIARRIEALRSELERADLSVDHTNQIRGALAELRVLVSEWRLAEPDAGEAALRAASKGITY